MGAKTIMAMEREVGDGRNEEGEEGCSCSREEHAPRQAPHQNT